MKHVKSRTTVRVADPGIASISSAEGARRSSPMKMQVASYTCVLKKPKIFEGIFLKTLILQKSLHKFEEKKRKYIYLRCDWHPHRPWIFEMLSSISVAAPANQKSNPTHHAVEFRRAHPQTDRTHRGTEFYKFLHFDYGQIGIRARGARIVWVNLVTVNIQSQRTRLHPIGQIGTTQGHQKQI